MPRPSEVLVIIGDWRCEPRSGSGVQYVNVVSELEVVWMNFSIAACRCSTIIVPTSVNDRVVGPTLPLNVNYPSCQLQATSQRGDPDADIPGPCTSRLQGQTTTAPSIQSRARKSRADKMAKQLKPFTFVRTVRFSSWAHVKVRSLN